MFEENTKQINQIIANILAACSGIVLILVVLSASGFFEFGKTYTWLILIVGLLVSIMPRVMIHRVSDFFIKYYMMITVAVFIGLIGTSAHIGVYITYALVPILSCLYFEPSFIVKNSAFSYIVMLMSLYIGSANFYEVKYQGRDRLDMFIAYAVGFTIEFLVVTVVLYCFVKRAKRMMLERHSAEEQNHMKNVFLSNMSHEIRTPMNAIIGMAEVSLRMDMDKQLRNNISIIHSSATGLLEIINDILDFSKIEAGKLEILAQPYETKAFVHDITNIVNARNNGDVPIYYHVSDDIPETLIGDAGRIKQIVLNYASNAIKYTESGRIDITIQSEKVSDKKTYLICTVSDTGQGIKKEDMDKLFTMYGQVNQKINSGKEGTGIGLAICKSFVTRMGGSVNVESEFGVGSRFSFCIPQKIGSPAIKSDVQEKKSVKNELLIPKNTHILLVDDNEINREVVKAMLEPFELIVDEAVNGSEAVEKAAHNCYNMILMDSHMPVMNGEEATRQIRRNEKESGNHVPIIALTADAINGVREKMMECGMDDFMVKPIDSSTLYRILKTYISSENEKPVDEKE